MINHTPPPNTQIDEQLLEGRTGEYAEATADAFLDDWLKTDAERARDAAAAAASASHESAAAISHDHPLEPDRKNKGEGVALTDAGAGENGGEGHHPLATHRHDSSRTILATHKRRRSSHGHSRGGEYRHHLGRHHHHHHHNDRSHHDGGRHAPEARRSSYGPARTASNPSSDNGEAGSGSHATGEGAPHGRHRGGGGGGGGGDGHETKGSPHRRRHASPRPTQAPHGGFLHRPSDSREAAAKHHLRRHRADENSASVKSLSLDNHDKNSPATEHRRGRTAEAEVGGGSLREGPQQERSKAPNQVRDDGEERESESLRRANYDAAILRATVERLESELNSVRAGAGMGGGGMAAVGDAAFGLGGGNGGMRFSAAAAAAPVAGPPWVAGGMAGEM